jgi:hypothetical protein
MQAVKVLLGFYSHDKYFFNNGLYKIQSFVDVVMIIMGSVEMRNSAKCLAVKIYYCASFK